MYEVEDSYDQYLFHKILEKLDRSQKFILLKSITGYVNNHAFKNLNNKNGGKGIYYQENLIIMTKKSNTHKNLITIFFPKDLEYSPGVIEEVFNSPLSNSKYILLRNFEISQIPENEENINKIYFYQKNSVLEIVKNKTISINSNEIETRANDLLKQLNSKKDFITFKEGISQNFNFYDILTIFVAKEKNNNYRNKSKVNNLILQKVSQLFSINNDVLVKILKYTKSLYSISEKFINELYTVIMEEKMQIRENNNICLFIYRKAKKLFRKFNKKIRFEDSANTSSNNFQNLTIKKFLDNNDFSKKEVLISRMKIKYNPYVYYIYEMFMLRHKFILFLGELEHVNPENFKNYFLTNYDTFRNHFPEEKFILLTKILQLFELAKLSKHNKNDNFYHQMKENSFVENFGIFLCNNLKNNHDKDILRILKIIYTKGYISEEIKQVLETFQFKV